MNDEPQTREPPCSDPECGQVQAGEPQADGVRLKQIIEALLLAAGRPLSVEQLLGVFTDEERPARGELHAVLTALTEDFRQHGIELVEVGSGFRLQIRKEMQTWVSRLWEEKPARYSRALLETLALIAYRQPITRGEIEEVRGVTVSTSIMKTLQDREWIRIVGHRDVPGHPAMYGTTKQFLDYFSLKSLDELPSLAELRDLGSYGPELQLDLAESVVESTLPPANDEAEAPGHAREGVPAGESAEDSAVLH